VPTLQKFVPDLSSLPSFIEFTDFFIFLYQLLLSFIKFEDVNHLFLSTYLPLFLTSVKIVILINFYRT